MTEYINPWKMWVGSFIPNWLMAQHELSQGAKLCYARLSQYAGRKGYAWPKQETLAEELGCHEREVRNYLTELVKVGLVESKRLGLGKPNEYRFLAHPWINFTADDEVLDRQHSAALERQDSAAPIIEENQGRESESSVSSEHSENTPPPPLPLAAFKEAVLAYLSADAKSRVSRLVDIGDSLGYERNGGFAAALTRDFDHGMKVVNAMVEGVTARGDPWAYVRKALDGQARKSAWSGQGGTQPAEGTGGGLVTVSREEVEAALKAKADEAARAGAGADAGQGASGLLPGPEAP